MSTELENAGMTVVKWSTRRAIRNLFMNGTCRHKGRQYDLVQATQLADFATLQSVHVALGTKSRDAEVLGLPTASDFHRVRRPRPAQVLDGVHQISARTYNCESLRVVGRIDELLRLARTSEIHVLMLQGTSMDIDIDVQYRISFYCAWSALFSPGDD
ncbi:unnamed protein product [Prorocentrum cordatum]|uniref:Uncharacterized protein n=1 Tax=Prorocentrum cordatum TaxID=2364126 RepID=A0ABN9S977_9DINO|nr:unnamed protein product [Polarella glacialis]